MSNKTVFRNRLFLYYIKYFWLKRIEKEERTASNDQNSDENYYEKNCFAEIFCNIRDYDVITESAMQSEYHTLILDHTHILMKRGGSHGLLVKEGDCDRRLPPGAPTVYCLLLLHPQLIHRLWWFVKCKGEINIAHHNKQKWSHFVVGNGTLVSFGWERLKRWKTDPCCPAQTSTADFRLPSQQRGLGKVFLK